MGDFNTLLGSMDKSSRHKINRETQALKDTLYWIDLTDIYRTFHPKAAEYTFFSSAFGTFPRADHTLGHKASLGKFKKTEIISSIFSDHNTLRLEINYKKKKKNCNWALLIGLTHHSQSLALFQSRKTETQPTKKKVLFTVLNFKIHVSMEFYFSVLGTQNSIF